MPFVSILLLGLLLLGGCASPEPLAGEKIAASQRPYVSEITLPESKAYYGFAQFRLLINENRWDEAIAALERALSFDPDSERLQISLAKAYLHNQQLEEGGLALERLLGNFPDNQRGLELLGELRSYQKRYAEAVSAFRRILTADPANEEIRLRLIDVFKKQKDPTRAITETHLLLEMNADSLAGNLMLARLQRGNNQVAAAIQTYRDLLIRRPGQLQAILELAQLLEEGKQLAAAINLYRESILEHPELLALYKQLGRILILQERYDEALKLLKQADQRQPGDLQILNRIGLLQLSRKDYSLAEATFRQILQQKPDLPRPLYSLGMSLVGQERIPEALENLKLIPPKSDVYPEAVIQRAYLHRLQGDIEQGIEVLQQAVESGQRTVESYYYLSTFLGEAERFSAAGQIVRQGLEFFPEEPSLHYQLGVIYEQMDDRRQALAVMEQVLTYEPTHADALNFIAYHFAELGENLEQALEQAKLALEQKQSSYIHDTLGWIYFRMARYAEAQRHLESAIAIDAEDPLIHDHLGDVYLAQKRWAEAENAYRRALELDKDAEAVEAKLKQLLKDHSL